MKKLIFALALSLSAQDSVKEGLKTEIAKLQRDYNGTKTEQAEMRTYYENLVKKEKQLEDVLKIKIAEANKQCGDAKVFDTQELICKAKEKTVEKSK